MKSFEELYQDASALCREIETIPAGEQQTKVSVMAAQMAADISELERAPLAISFPNPPTKIYYHCKTCFRLFEVVEGMNIVIDKLPTEVVGFQLVHDFECNLPNCKTFRAS